MVKKMKRIRIMYGKEELFSYDVDNKNWKTWTISFWNKGKEIDELAIWNKPLLQRISRRSLMSRLRTYFKFD